MVSLRPVLALLLFNALLYALGDNSGTGGTTGADILVLIDSPALKETHSEFFKSLETRGHKLDVRMADDAQLELFKFGKPLYQHLIVFAPSVEEFGGSVSVAEIANFIDAGGNVLVAASSNLGEAIRDLATEVGFEFDEAGTAVIDHHNYDTKLDEGRHTTIVVPSTQLIGAELIAGRRGQLAPVLFRGVSLIADASNPLRLEVLTADTTAFSFNPRSATVEEYPAAVGKSVILVGALQARNNARVVLTGSLDLFSNAFFSAAINKAGESSSSGGAAKSGNRHLAEALSKWVFKETGMLRVVGVEHHRVGETKPPQEYTIMDEVTYSITIEELSDGKWTPFKGDDVQLEFVRIDPFVRTTLKNNKGRLSTTFKIPDVYGVYKFLVDYRRVGYTHLYEVRQVSVRPLLHTQYERFSRCAYPYYVSAFSMMLGVVIFSFVFLYYKEPTAGQKEGTATGSKGISPSSTGGKAQAHHVKGGGSVGRKVD